MHIFYTIFLTLKVEGSM